MDSEKRQELEESLAFLRGRFEELNQDIKRPHSLDAEVLRKKLEELEAAPPVRPALRFPKQWRAAEGIAACVVFVVGAFLLQRIFWAAPRLLRALPPPLRLRRVRPLWSRKRGRLGKRR